MVGQMAQMTAQERYNRSTANRLAAGLPETITDPVALWVAMSVTANHLATAVELEAPADIA